MAIVRSMTQDELTDALIAAIKEQQGRPHPLPPPIVHAFVDTVNDRLKPFCTAIVVPIRRLVGVFTDAGVEELYTYEYVIDNPRTCVTEAVSIARKVAHRLESEK